jgi:hypothetical protein
MPTPVHATPAILSGKLPDVVVVEMLDGDHVEYRRRYDECGQGALASTGNSKADEVRRRATAHRHSSAQVVWLDGPCPGCYDKLRASHRVSRSEAIEITGRAVRVPLDAVIEMRPAPRSPKMLAPGVRELAAPLATRVELTLPYDVVHAGCFEGRLIRSRWERMRNTRAGSRKGGS